VSDDFGQSIFSTGSPAVPLREQRRLGILARWVSYAAEHGVPTTVTSDRSPSSFLDSIIERVWAECFDVILMDQNIHGDFFWRRAVKKLTEISPVPFWLTSAVEIRWRTGILAPGPASIQRVAS
jgi:hypothetical protein